MKRRERLQQMLERYELQADMADETGKPDIAKKMRIAAMRTQAELDKLEEEE